MVNKKGIIRVLESILAVLILLGVVITLISQQQTTKTDVTGNIYSIQNQILLEISENNSLRTAVINEDYKPLECFIESRINRFSMDFNISICAPENACYCDTPSGKEIYTNDVVISTNITERDFTPKKIILCSWSGKLTKREC